MIKHYLSIFIIIILSHYHHHHANIQELKKSPIFSFVKNFIVTMALAQIPISTFSHIWVFVCQYGIMFVIIVIAIIIIIIIYRKVKVSTLKHV